MTSSTFLNLRVHLQEDSFPYRYGKICLHAEITVKGFYKMYVRYKSLRYLIIKYLKYFILGIL